MTRLVSAIVFLAVVGLAWFALARIRNLVAKRRERKTSLPDDLADVAEDVAAASRIAAALAAAAAFAAAPAGLLAIGAALGLVSTPAVVTVAPWLLAFAAGTAALSAAAKLYAKSRRRRIAADKSAA